MKYNFQPDNNNLLDDLKAVVNDMEETGFALRDQYAIDKLKAIIYECEMEILEFDRDQAEEHLHVESELHDQAAGLRELVMEHNANQN